MRTKENLYPAIRTAVLALLFLITAAAQNVFFSSLPVPLILLVPLTVSVCVYEGEFTGLFFGLAAGALYDAVSPVPDGIFALLFAALGCAVGFLARFIFRNTLMSAFLLTLAFSLLTVLTSFVFNVAFKNPSLALHSYAGFYISGALLTSALLPVFYYPVKFLETKLKKT